ncbi:MAG: hypothetical protein KC445_15875 [Anaerolineales bacterium]|nr:hypothetical protein [Anaerolineales bacterium]
MKEQDPILADELNRRINAEMQGKAKPPVSDAIQQETELATKLINLAQETHPDPDFMANLGSQLARRAARKQQLKNKAAPPERPSFWRQLEQLLKEGTTMNRNKYLLGALGVVALLLVGAYVLFSRGNNNTVEPVADATGSDVQTDTDQPTTEPAATDEAVAVADLPPLPVLDGGAQASGLGGGGASARPFGGGGGGIATEGAAIAADGNFIFTDPFSGTVFTLNTTLPTEPRLATVIQNSPNEALLLEQAQELANRFGFSTQLYREQYPVFETQPGERVYEPPVVYHLFEGSRTLIVDQWGAYYNDNSIINDYENPIAFETAVPIAEAFLQERGLLNFDYEVQQIWGSDVNFVRTIDGEPSNQPELTVGVSHDGRVFFVSYQVMRNAETLGRYPLISAQEAWDILQSGVTDNNVLYQFVVRPELAIEEPIFVDPAADLYRSWMREYAAGEEIHLYDWPVVYLPVDNAGDPRIQLRNYVIQADSATLNALAERVGQQTHIWGQMGADGITVELTGWEPIVGNLEPPVSGPGTISRSDDQVLFTDNNTGNVFIVPDAPSDLEAGTEVYLFAWAARDLGQAYPVLDWENMDKAVTFPPTEEVIIGEPIVEEPLPVDVPFEPFTYQSVTVNEVSLAYYTTYNWPTNENGEVSYDGQPTIIVQPTWKFSGETNDGYFVEFFVQAPQPDFLNR